MRAEGFFYNLDILYGGLGIDKLQFLIKKKYRKFFSAVIFFQFLVIKALDPDWIRIRIGLQPQTPDPDPEKMNTDPQPWKQDIIFYRETYSSRIVCSKSVLWIQSNFFRIRSYLEMWIQLYH